MFSALIQQQLYPHLFLFDASGSLTSHSWETSFMKVGLLIVLSFFLVKLLHTSSMELKQNI